MQYLLETYGCQMNKAESAALESIFRERGWSATEMPEAADVVVINTCSVRLTAENRAWGRIDHFASIKKRRALQRAKAEAPGMQILSREAGPGPLSLVVTGCMAERMKQEMQKQQPAIDYVIGTFQKQAFGLLLDAVEKGLTLDSLEESPSFVFSDSHYEPGSFRSFVPIMHGCDNYCSYCIVPYLRGHEVSRAPSSILAEIASLEDSGVREITLLGQNVNSYRWKGRAEAAQSETASASRGPVSALDDQNLDFPGLLRLIAAELKARGRKGVRWIRFLTSHPKDLSDEVIAVLAQEKLLCKHVHLCVQSGSDAILKAMNRHYSREDYLALVQRMKNKVPGLSLSTDILVGFPGESEEDLGETMQLMKDVGYAFSYMYYYNPREGTPAAVMSNRIPDKIKKDRLARVIALQQEITSQTMAQRVGSVDEVLIESVSRKKKTEVLGRTQRDEMVVFPAPASRVGDFAKVRLLSLSGNTFKAEEILE